MSFAHFFTQIRTVLQTQVSLVENILEKSEESFYFLTCSKERNLADQLSEAILLCSGCKKIELNELLLYN